MEKAPGERRVCNTGGSGASNDAHGIVLVVSAWPRVSRVIACLIAAGAPFLAFAQYGSTGQQVEPNNYPPALPDRHGPAPRYVFEPLGEIAIPGPLGEAPAYVLGDEVAVPVASGIARVKPELDAAPRIDTSAVPATDPWITEPGRKRRYRTTLEGIVEAESWSKIRKRWVRRWKIVAPNSFLAPPVLVGPRLCYAGLDDLVTCVRASNGHRLWAIDTGDRVSRPISRWPTLPPDPKHAKGERGVEGEILLVVPDSGASVIALDAYDGTRVAVFDLPAPRRFASPALVVPGDRIALARKGYEDSEAALVLLRLTPSKTSPATPVPYNGPSPKPETPSGR